MFREAGTAFLCVCFLQRRARAANPNDRRNAACRKNGSDPPSMVIIMRTGVNASPERIPMISRRVTMINEGHVKDGKRPEAAGRLRLKCL